MNRERLLSAAVLGARGVLGFSFLYLGYLKVLDPVAFLKVLRQYDVLHDYFLLNVTAAILPWMEMWLGAMILLGIGLRGSAVLMLILTAGFTFEVARRALGIYRSSGTPFCAIAFDCGCGGGVVRICAKLLENLCLIALSGLVVFFPNGRWCLFPILFLMPRK